MIFFLVAFIATYVQSISAQETTQPTNTLNAYYAVKDALVSGNAPSLPAGVLWKL